MDTHANAQERRAAYCVANTMMEAAWNSNVGDRALHDPHAAAMAHLLQCDLVTEANRDLFLVEPHRLTVAMIHQCACTPCLHAAVWPLIESLGDNQDALAMGDGPRCMQLASHRCSTSDPWFRWTVGLPDRDGDTALMELLSSASSDTGTRRVFHAIEAYAHACNVAHVNDKGQTALMLACKGWSDNVLVKLIETFGSNCNVGQVDNNGNTTLIEACRFNDSSKATKLIETFSNACMPGHANNFGNTALMVAVDTTCQHGDSIANVAKLIEEFGLDCRPGQANRDGNTALLMSVPSGSSGSPGVAAELVEAFGRDCLPGHVNTQGDTALSRAYGWNIPVTDMVHIIRGLGVHAPNPSRVLQRLESVAIPFRREHCLPLTEPLALATLQVAQVVHQHDPAAVDTLRARLVWRCGRDEADLAKRLVDGIVTPAGGYALAEELAESCNSWNLQEWSTSRLSLVTKAVELCGELPHLRKHLMEQAIKARDEKCALRVLQLLGRPAEAQRETLLDHAATAGLRRVVKQLKSRHAAGAASLDEFLAAFAAHKTKPIVFLGVYVAPAPMLLVSCGDFWFKEEVAKVVGRLLCVCVPIVRMMLLA